MSRIFQWVRRAPKIAVAAGLFGVAVILLMPLGLSLIGKKGPIAQFANENPGLSIAALKLSFSVAVTRPVVFREYFRSLRLPKPLRLLIAALQATGSILTPLGRGLRNRQTCCSFESKNPQC
jgi:hypothetical protein